ncbi:lipopolysaccharide assembly protein LapA domain-containing protein [Halobacillus sp. HZG1]|uniref:LapA family protein n=1 Tax=Halobacillus sp. HZG1 TaxID=3111769 RepID=UPI002DB59125|nr:lipopolysaccharide assembly protein LapA domain-containing protein [Halobacillus sp. HZG1]MEC3882594.1 lipopolysaccharide assembly protein LapA domain-containing protein [Halobacillus sp. HZG1]
MKGQSYLILAFVFALVIAIFAVINVDPVQVNYLFGSGEAPLILVILISVLLGGLATASVGALRYYKLKRENSRLKSEASASPASVKDEDRNVSDENETANEEESSSSKVT